jgi:predicted nuclease with TOPRIM domain
MSTNRKISSIVPDADDNTIREAKDGRKFIVVQLDAEVVGDTIYQEERKAVFGSVELLNSIKPGMKLAA